MENKIDSYIETVDNWKLWQMIFIFPIFVFSFVIIPSAFIWLGRENSYDNNGINLFPLEYKLPMSPKLLFYFGVVVCLYYLLIVLFKEKNKIHAIRMNNYALPVLYFIFYYQMTIALQYFISFTVIRLFNWFIFICSLGVIIYIISTRKYEKISFFTEERVAKIPKLAGGLWLVLTVVGLLFKSFADFKELLWKTATPFMPAVLVVISLGLFSFLFEILDYLKKVDHNQEYYREKYGYTVLDWYGSKSKEYKMEMSKKEEVNQKN